MRVGEFTKKLVGGDRVTLKIIFCNACVCVRIHF
jgi:hypothetical protein